MSVTNCCYYSPHFAPGFAALGIRRASSHPVFVMDIFHAKLVAAATGATMTALTSTSTVLFAFHAYRPSSDPVRCRQDPPADAAQGAVALSHRTCQVLSTAKCPLCPEHVVSCALFSRRGGSVCLRPRCAQERACLWLFGCGPTRREGRGSQRALERCWDNIVGTYLCARILTPTWTYRLVGVPSSTMYMLTYDHLLRNVLPPLIPSPSLVPLVAGITARTCLTSLLSPLELVRTNLQSTPKSPDQPHTLSSVLGSIRTVVRQQGILFLWRGLGPTLWRDVPFSGIYWAGYEAWKQHFESRGKTGTYVTFASGAISGTTASLLTQPFDVLKTRRQALLMSGTLPTRKTATIPLCLRILRTEGASALFAGVLPRTAKIAPACGIMIACFEVCILCVRPTHMLTINRVWVNFWKRTRINLSLTFERITHIDIRYSVVIDDILVYLRIWHIGHDHGIVTIQLSYYRKHIVQPSLFNCFFALESLFPTRSTSLLRLSSTSFWVRSSALIASPRCRCR